MPRFSENEKNRIRKCLIDEGEKLFITHGIKKVTIDEIAAVAKIAKASFYKFYDGKEYLFLDIALERQKEIFEQLNIILQKSKRMTDKNKVRNVFMSMSMLMRNYPLLSMIDKDTVEIIMRKVDMERVKGFNGQGIDVVQFMVDNGVKFKVSAVVASQLFRALYQSWIYMTGQPEEIQKQVIDIMLDGILDKIL